MFDWITSLKWATIQQMEHFGMILWKFDTFTLLDLLSELNKHAHTWPTQVNGLGALLLLIHLQLILQQIQLVLLQTIPAVRQVCVMLILGSMVNVELVLWNSLKLFLKLKFLQGASLDVVMWALWTLRLTVRWRHTKTSGRLTKTYFKTESLMFTRDKDQLMQKLNC